jgi:uncharacterized repeat protein (TIGR04138 family)
MQAVSFEEALDLLVATDKRFKRDAYLFVRDALEHTRKLVDRENKETRVTQHRGPAPEKHVTGQQLLQGVRELALENFGPMTSMVFEEWGIRACRDFGEIVFAMVEHQLLKKTENDSPADFENGYDFDDAFRKPFLPVQKLAALREPAKEAKA